MQVDFYQLTREPAENVLPAIAERAVEGGGRLLVVGGDEVQLNAISNALWAWKPHSFLAHSMVGEADDSAQPILLSATSEPTNGARLIAIVDGHWRDEAFAFDRAFYLFEPKDTDRARAAWRAMAERDDVERRYWKQDGRRWVQGP